MEECFFKDKNCSNSCVAYTATKSCVLVDAMRSLIKWVEPNKNSVKYAVSAPAPDIIKK